MKGTITLFATICCLHLYAQEVDLVRLGYAESEIISKQIGMAASPDGMHIAFVQDS